MIKMGKYSIINTKRLTIRELEYSDLDALFKIRSKEEVYKYVIWGPISYSECKSMLEKQIKFQQESNRKVYVFGVTLNGTLIGECFIVIKDKDSTAEIGYYFHPNYWGMGFGIETLRGLLRIGFNDLKLHRIIAQCDDENFGSINVLEKAGFRLEAVFKKDSKIKGQWRDSRLYAILEEEWKIKLCRKPRFTSFY
jgi:[ribosomal protein S5]-alanine N-acetyltransferase